MKQLNLGAMLCRNAALYPERTALICENRQLTHAQLLSSAARIGHVFAGLGAHRGDRIAILARNSIEMVEALCACELHGYIAVPLNHRLADAELSVIMNDCRPSVLVVDNEFVDSAAALHQACEHGMEILTLGEAHQSFRSLQTAQREAEAALPLQSGADDIAYIVYTSGSTGRPKGVMLSHAALVESGRVLATPAGVRPDSVQIVVMPLFHVGATAQRMGYVVNGATLVLHRKFDPERIVRELASGNVTDIHLAPTMLRSVLDEIGERSMDFGRLETVKYASSPIPEDTLARAMRAFGPKLLQYYALTEAGGVASVLHKFVHMEAMNGENVGRLRSAGQAHFGCDIQLRRPDGHRCESDEEGEIWLRSQAMMSGYWNNPVLTKETIVDGWLRTGDAGRFDREQYLFIMDRLKDMIVSGGENIYSSEVERALEAHPHVLEAAVVGVPDAHWGEAVHAFVVLRSGAPQVTADELIDFCKRRLASYKKPRSIEFLPALPRLQHVQKIDKPALRKPYWAARQRSVN